MLIVHIQIHVLTDQIDAFRKATEENARNSIQEPGIARFDIFQQNDDPSRFLFIEIYRDAAAVAAHKETAHYAKWRDTVEPMMAEPRSRLQYTNVFPDETGF